MKIQTKTTLLFTTLTAVFFVILGIAVYFFLDIAENNDFHKRLELRARISVKFRFEQNEVSTEAFREIQREYLEKLTDERAFVFQVNKTTGQFTPAPTTEVNSKYLQEIRNANGGTVYRQNKFRHYAGLLYHDETGDFIVIKSAINRYGIELMKHLRDIMIITLVCSVLFIYLMGYYFSKTTFLPFRKINNKVKQINENNLHLRLEEVQGSDEVAELTGTFNKMIDRIEMAFESQNNFISNASHELRTPLTSIIGESDYALSKERTVEEYKKSIQNINHEAFKLQQLTTGLLGLAQTGFNGKKIEWKKLRLDQLVFDVKDNIDSILPENKVLVSMLQLPEDESRISITGSSDLLKIALGNIILNACKYSDNQIVTLQLSFGEKHGIITVTDKGIGIPEQELRYIYDPFFRASNTQPYEGYGIGMPLAHNIIRLHKGKIDVTSKTGEGTIVEIYLPLS